MLATLGVLPAGLGWGHDFKWDGVRAITYIEPERVWVVSRNDRTYPELGELTALLHRPPVVPDGEIVALDPAGRPSLAQLQRRMHVVSPTGSLLRAVGLVFGVGGKGSAHQRIGEQEPGRQVVASVTELEGGGQAEVGSGRRTAEPAARAAPDIVASRKRLDTRIPL